MARRRTTRRRTVAWVVGGAGAVIVLVVGAVLFQPWLLFVDVRVADRIPSSQTTAPDVVEPVEMAAPTVEDATSAAPAGPRDLLAGSLISHEHETSGSVRIIENPDGTRQVALVGLETSNGPDVHVWLSAGPVVEGRDGWYTAASYDHVDLGPLRGNLGDQLYDIPAEVDLSTFRTVDLWCERFGVSFGAAALS